MPIMFASIRPISALASSGCCSCWLIGGVNLVNLLLIRASARAKEFSIRRINGASRRQIVSQVAG